MWAGLWNIGNLESTCMKCKKKKKKHEENSFKCKEGEKKILLDMFSDHLLSADKKVSKQFWDPEVKPLVPFKTDVMWKGTKCD